jgi:Lon protease-like protein
MSQFDSASPGADTPAGQQALEIPLFPLDVVLFPGGSLRLKVFRQRYGDMAAACIRDQSPFGVCLIAGGREAGSAMVPHAVGTLAHIVGVDMPQTGIMIVDVRGGRRFRINTQTIAADGFRRAHVSLLEEPQAQSIPSVHEALRSLLQRMTSAQGPDDTPEPHAFDDATWLGYRLAEVLPLTNLARQQLLELENPFSRLEVLSTSLSRHDLDSKEQ